MLKTGIPDVKLSYAPHTADAVNVVIRDEDARVKYATITDAIRILLKFEGADMAKADIKDAYRQIPLAPDQHWLVGFKVKRKLFP